MKFFLLFFVGLFFFLPVSSFAAVELFLDPAYRQVNVGDTFIMNVRIKTDSECVNAVSAEIAYDIKSLKAIDFSTGSSLISLWVATPKIDHEKGIITFSGGIPGGYCGRVLGDPGITNLLGKIIFSTPLTLLKNTLPVSAFVKLNNSEVLLNDGLGTNVGATNTNANVVISNTREGVINEWQTEVRSDIIAPELFDIIVSRDPKIKDGKYFISWSTLDKQSGIDHYEVLETSPWKFGSFVGTNKNSEWVKSNSPYFLKDQNLRSKIMVKAIDKMGNERIVEYTPNTSLLFGIKKTWFWGGISMGIFVFVLLTGLLIWRKIKKTNDAFIPPQNEDFPL